MRYLTVLLFLLPVRAPAQVEDIAALLAEGKYLKCIRKADKHLGKYSREPEVLLLKALCLCEGERVLPDEDDLRRGVENSLIVMKTIQRIDKDGSFAAAHRKEIEAIQEAARLKLDSLVTNGRCNSSRSLSDNLIALFDDPAGRYYRGKCLMATDEAEAAECWEKACTKMYSRWKSGEIKQPYLQAAFADFAIYLIGHERPDAARDVILHGEDLFEQDGLMAWAGVAMLEYGLSTIGNYSTPGDVRTWLDFAKELLSSHPGDAHLAELKLKIASAYLALLSEGGGDADIARLITDTLNGDPAYLAQTMLMVEDLLCRLTLKDPKTLKANEANRWKLADAYHRLGLNHGMTAASEVADLHKAGRYLQALILNYYLQRLSTADGLVQIEVELLKAVRRGNDRQQSQTLDELMTLLVAFPEEKLLRQTIVNMGLDLGERFLAERDFGRSGVAIRAAYAVDPASHDVNELFRRWVIEDYETNYLNSDLTDAEMGWTGSAEHCEPGTTSQLTFDKSLQRLNYFRRLAGVPDSCTWNDEWHAAAQAAALCMLANYSLSHAPPKSWKCYSDLAYKGAANCNLSLGESGPDAITGQMEDEGSNNKAVGHRRYILNPYKSEYAIGNTTGSMALYVFGKSLFDSTTAIYASRPVTWPPAGYVPEDLVFRRWHFSLPAGDFRDARITLTRGGVAVPIEIADGEAYGHIVWEVDGRDYRGEETTYIVEITGVKLWNDPKVMNFQYEVKTVVGL